MGKDLRILHICLGGIILHNILRKISASLAVLMLLALSAPVLTYAASILKVYYNASTGEISGVIYSDQKNIELSLDDPSGGKVQVPSSVLGEVYGSGNRSLYWSKVNGMIAPGLTPGSATVIAGDTRNFASSLAGNLYSFEDAPAAPQMQFVNTERKFHKEDNSADVQIAWFNSKSIGVSHYNIYQNDNFIGSTVRTYATIHNLPCFSIQKFKVTAVDVLGRESAYSDINTFRVKGTMKEAEFLFSGKEPGYALQPSDGLISFVLTGDTGANRPDAWRDLSLFLGGAANNTGTEPYKINHGEISSTDFELVAYDGSVYPVSYLYHVDYFFQFKFGVDLEVDKRYTLRLTSSASGNELGLPDINSNEGSVDLNVSASKTGEFYLYGYSHKADIIIGDPYAPAQPTGLKASGDGSLSVTWDSNKEADLEGYLVWLDGRLLTGKPITQTSYTINGLTNGHKYHVNVGAVDKVGNRSLQAYIFPVPLAMATGDTPTSVSGSAPAVVKPVITVVDNTGTGKNLDTVLKSENGKVRVSVASNIKQLLLPASSEMLNKDNALIVAKDDLSIQIPGGVLEQLKSSVSAELLKDARLSLTFTPLGSKDITDAVSSITAQSANTAITSAGAAFDFGLSLITADGKETKLSDFATPVTLKLKVNEGVNSLLTGVYYLNAQGGLQYTAGQLENGYLSVQTGHFSKYAVIQYIKSFSDVPATHWASGAVQVMVAQQVVTGTSDLTFSPYQNVTRAEFAALIARKLNLKTSETNRFNDVASGKWYAESITATAEAGIVTGTSGSAFAPDELISRQEMVAMLIKAYLLKNNQSMSAMEDASPFADQGSISKWAQPYAAYAHELGLIQGRSGNKFQPLQHATRAEAVHLISKL